MSLQSLLDGLDIHFSNIECISLQYSFLLSSLDVVLDGIAIAPNVLFTTCLAIALPVPKANPSATTLPKDGVFDDGNIFGKELFGGGGVEVAVDICGFGDGGFKTRFIFVLYATIII